MSEYLKMPWSVEDTIENLEFVKELYKNLVRRGNLDGKGDEDAEEIEFDFNRAIEALEQTRWIPVSERLPDKDIPDPYVLISCWSEADDYFVQEAYAYRDASDVICFDSLYSKDKVLAWMPLPKPYKEGEQE